MQTNQELNEVEQEIKKDVEERFHERCMEQRYSDYIERMSGYGK